MKDVPQLVFVADFMNFVFDGYSRLPCKARGLLGFLIKLFLLGLGSLSCQLQPVISTSDSIVRGLESYPRLCFMDSGDGHEHQKNLRTSFDEILIGRQTDPVKISVKIQFLPIYEVDGQLLKRKFLQQIESAKQNCDLVHLSWNLTHSSGFLEVESALSELARDSVVLVAAAGEPENLVRQRNLSESVIGHVPQALIVGERTAEGTLKFPSFTGAEMLTALESPKGREGSSFSSLYLTAEIFIRWPMRSKQEWLSWSQKIINSHRSEEQQGSESGARSLRIFRSPQELIFLSN